MQWQRTYGKSDSCDKSLTRFSKLLYRLDLVFELHQFSKTSFGDISEDNKQTKVISVLTIKVATYPIQTMHNISNDHSFVEKTLYTFSYKSNIYHNDQKLA